MKFIQQQHRILSLLLLLIISSLTMISFDRPLVRGDGIAYFAWLDTLVLDHDLNLNNQYERFEPVNTYQITWNSKQQQWVIIFPFGTAFLQAPFYLVGHWFLENDWFNYNPDYFHQMQGLQLPYSIWIMIGTNIMSLISLSLLWDLSRELVGDWLAALLSFAFFVGTPLIYYTTVEPLNSHSSGAFSLSLFFYLFAKRTFFSDPKTQDNTGYLYWIFTGITAGITVLVRWQLLLAVAPAWLILLYRKEWKIFFVSGFAFAFSLLPLFLVWNAMFGSYITIPYNEVEQESFLNFANNAWFQVLKANTIYSPLTVLGFSGIAVLAWQKRWLWAAFFALIIVGQLFINGSALDWYAGNSYGMRRMSELYPIYVILGAVSIAAIPKLESSQILKITAGLILLGIIFYSLLYLVAFLDYIWTSQESWSGSLYPNNVIPYLINQPYRTEVLQAVFEAHIGPPSWTMPGP